VAAKRIVGSPPAHERRQFAQMEVGARGGSRSVPRRFTRGLRQSTSAGPSRRRVAFAPPGTESPKLCNGPEACRDGVSVEIGNNSGARFQSFTQPRAHSVDSAMMSRPPLRGAAGLTRLQ
jgi:hypothetical protein